MKHLYASILALPLLLAQPGPAAALATDREEPIHIQADRVEINEQTGVSVYRGDVKVTQGSMELLADRIVVHRKGETLDRIEAEGRPARFSQRQDESGELVRGQARHIEYRTAADLALLVGEGRILRGRDEFRGERIEYDTVRNIVRAAGGGENGDRVHAVIHPKPKEQSR